MGKLGDDLLIRIRFLTSSDGEGWRKNFCNEQDEVDNMGPDTDGALGCHQLLPHILLMPAYGVIPTLHD